MMQVSSLLAYKILLFMVCFFLLLLSLSPCSEVHPQILLMPHKVKVMKRQGSSRTAASGALSAGFTSHITTTTSASKLPASSCPGVPDQESGSIF